MMSKKILKSLHKEILASPPIWFMRQAGRYLPEYRQLREKVGGFWNLCFTPDHATEVTLQPIRRFGFDAAILFSDILVIPKALGQSVEFAPNHGPILEKNDWPSMLDFSDWEKFHQTLGPIYNAIKQIRIELPQETTFIGFSGSPWTLATYMLDCGKASEFSLSKKALTDKSFLMPILDLLTESVTQYLMEQIRAGVEVIQIFDSWAGVVPPQDRQTILFEPLRKIVQGIRQTYPNFPIIYFGRGICDSYLDLINICPDIAYGIDQQTNIHWARETFPQDLCLQGNLDPEILKSGGDQLFEQVDFILESCRGRPHIFNLGHGILPETPIAHVEKVLEKVRLYGA